MQILFTNACGSVQHAFQKKCLYVQVQIFFINAYCSMQHAFFEKNCIPNAFFDWKCMLQFSTCISVLVTCITKNQLAFKKKMYVASACILKINAIPMQCCFWKCMLQYATCIFKIENACWNALFFKDACWKMQNAFSLLATCIHEINCISTAEKLYVQFQIFLQTHFAVSNMHAYVPSRVRHTQSTHLFTCAHLVHFLKHVLTLPKVAIWLLDCHLHKNLCVSTALELQL